MRILIIGDRSGQYNQHLHFDFFDKELRALGHTVFRWRARKGDGSFTSAVAHFGPDVVISHKPSSQGKDWLELPRHIKRVAIQVDYHYIDKLCPYLNASDLVFFRASKHPEVATQQHGLTAPARWLPFSVDTAALPQYRTDKDYTKVFFSGNSIASAYPMRNQVLRECRDIVASSGRILAYQAYLQKANQYGFGLACRSKYDLDPAKMLEYASVGCIPLCDSSPAQDVLLPGLSFHYSSPGDVRQIVARANPNTLRDMSAECRAYVRKHHSHAVRAKQFMEEITCSLF